MRVLRTLAPHLVALVVFAGYIAYHDQSPPIHTGPEEYQQLREGMTRDEAYATLGGPPGSRTSDPDHQPVFTAYCGSADYQYSHPIYRASIWETDAGRISATFDRHDRVEFLHFDNVPSPRPWRQRHALALMIYVGSVMAVGAFQLLNAMLPDPPDGTAVPPVEA